MRAFDPSSYFGVDLFAGGVPCPPFSKAGKQLGGSDDRDLFPVALDLIEQCHPKAVLLENVRGFLDKRFDRYRASIQRRLEVAGYRVFWQLVQASDFGVPQLRPRTLLVAVKIEYADGFEWPDAPRRRPPTVGRTLRAAMAAGGWEGADAWSLRANRIAPTLVGGSKRHGGPDLGPTRARRAWLELGVDGRGLADAPPPAGYEGVPRLTVPMAALLQGFPASWQIVGRKTNAYRQVGNAFPPPVAECVGRSIAKTLADAPAGAQTRMQIAV